MESGIAERVEEGGDLAYIVGQKGECFGGIWKWKKRKY
jgi:hypothetical protein